MEIISNVIQVHKIVHLLIWNLNNVSVKVVHQDIINNKMDPKLYVIKIAVLMIYMKIIYNV
jgi:hypothetical protein